VGAGEWGGDWGTGIVRKGEERYWEPLGQLKDSNLFCCFEPRSDR